MTNILTIRPPKLAAFYFLVTLGLHFLLRPHIIFNFDHRSWGVLTFVLGLTVMSWAWTLVRNQKTAIRPTEKPSVMIMDGPFEWSRNPMYLGMTLMLWGSAMFVGTLVMFFAPIAFLLTMNAVFILHEEEMMERAFGEEYLEYQSRVRRWL